MASAAMGSSMGFTASRTGALCVALALGVEGSISEGPPGSRRLCCVRVYASEGLKIELSSRPS